MVEGAIKKNRLREKKCFELKEFFKSIRADKKKFMQVSQVLSAQFVKIIHSN